MPSQAIPTLITERLTLRAPVAGDFPAYARLLASPRAKGIGGPYLQSVIARIEVDDQKVRVFSDRAELAAAATGLNTRPTKVRGFVRNWRARRDSNS